MSLEHSVSVCVHLNLNKCRNPGGASAPLPLPTNTHDSKYEAMCTFQEILTRDKMKEILTHSFQGLMLLCCTFLLPYQK